MMKISNKYKLLSVQLLILFLTSTSSFAIKSIEVPAQGEYTTINVKKSHHSILILERMKKGSREAEAKKIENAPGDFTPFALLELGLYLLEKRDYNNAALFLRLAMFRTVVDVKAANDSSLNDVVPTMFGLIQSKVSKLNKAERMKYIKALTEVSKKIINVDKNIPRNYDKRWACLHSIRAFSGGKINFATPKEYEKILQSEYRNYSKTIRNDLIN